MVRDHLGRKMSKSLGNGIDPLEVVNRFGADALRYTVITGAGPGMDQYLNYQDLELAFGPGRNFANKLWNAGRFALMTLGEEERVAVDEVRGSLELADRWILSRLSRASAEITAALERFRFQDAGQRGYDFFWSDLADWYLELAKPRLYGESGEESRRAARAVLAEVLDRAMRLLHPIMPFITEVVWLKLPRAAGDPDSLMVAAWPGPVTEWDDPAAEAALGELQQVVVEVRRMRQEYGIQPGVRVPLRVRVPSPALGEMLEQSRRALLDLARVEPLEFGSSGGEVGASAVLPSGTELFLPLAGVIDLERERGRLRGEAERVAGLAQGTERKLANESFVSRAPAEVVEKEREKLAGYREQVSRLEARIAELAGVA
jgi:valyl-tRNA synthetase